MLTATPPTTQYATFASERAVIACAKNTFAMYHRTRAAVLAT
jgi:hypothetical protein